MGCACGGGGASRIGANGFGHAMSADGVPISKDLPGYHAVPGVGMNAPLPDPVPTGLNTKVFGCPAWAWLLAAGLMMWDHKRGVR
jgi:hypothetical protein